MSAVLKVVVPLFLAPVLVSCGEREPQQVGPPEPLNLAAKAPPLAEPPPMIVRTPQYRCDDGGALYVSVLTDQSHVTLRDRLGTVPVRLEQNAQTGRYEGEGRVLSGTGDTIRYASPERPEQECRAAG